MAIIKCKMCGGDIELTADKTFGTCEFCGSTMTLPKIDDDQRAAAFNRGNHFRRIGEFDKALAVYERIVREDDTDAEAHWCCALCRFGIEYVEDPATYEYLPTCHRASFDSFLEDIDYLAAVEHSEGITKRQYQKDGAKIAEVQRGILATSQNAEPYDVFICYKESDADGNRTRDSLLAQDIYYQLTEQGRKVFFARITLEDVAGAQYEPYIFAALNSAKVMIVVGTKAEYLNAVWVKNEWSRFLAMMKKDRHKLLLPCYRDMDPYDMPEALSVLQSYDMSKIGFIQDLTRGIAKVLDAGKKPEPVKETVVVQQTGGTNIAPLLKRAFMFLEDGDWISANEYCEKVLDIDPENAQAYLGKLMAELKANSLKSLKDQDEAFDSKINYQKAVRFADERLRTALAGCIKYINHRNENARVEGIYAQAKNAMAVATAAKYIEAANLFETISGYKDSEMLIQICYKKAEADRKEAARVAKNRKRIAAIIAAIVGVAVAFVFILNAVIIPNLHKQAYIDAHGVASYSMLEEADIGSVVCFGAYEQDNNLENGKETIEWIVLDKTDDSVLVLSVYGLDHQLFHEGNSATWESCTLRTWLNTTFLEAAFDESEQNLILSSTVTADENPEHGWSQGADTVDQLFLLSVLEVQKYMPSLSDRLCKPTPYAESRGADAYFDDGQFSMHNGYCSWWLRTRGMEECASTIHIDGDIFNVVNVDWDGSDEAIRPVMWIRVK